MAEAGRLVHTISLNYGKHSSLVLARTNVLAVDSTARGLIGAREVIECPHAPDLDQFQKFISDGKVPIQLVNFDILVSRENRFSGHYLVLTGFDETSFFYHETGPMFAEHNKAVSKALFVQCSDLCFLDHGLIVV